MLKVLKCHQKFIDFLKVECCKDICSYITAAAAAAITTIENCKTHLIK